MKLVEVGNGLKSIEVPDYYYSDWEDDDQTVILYTAEENGLVIRWSVLSVEPKEGAAVDKLFHYVIQRGEEEGYSVKKVGDKSFYQYVVESEEESSITFHYEVGYKWSFIVLSITTALEKKEASEVMDTLKEVEQMIVSLKEINPDEMTLFEPKYSDYKEIYERVSQILSVKEEEIDDFHQRNKTLSFIQNLLDKEVYDAEQSYELQSLGMALGDYMQYKERNLRWAVVRDEYGRDLCLHHQGCNLTLFPLTMLEKRVKEGELISVKGLVEALFEKIQEVIDENEESEGNDGSE